MQGLNDCTIVGQYRFNVGSQYRGSMIPQYNVNCKAVLVVNMALNDPLNKSGPFNKRSINSQ